MGGYVKNTMLDKVISLVAPHYCCGCGLVGTILCDNCKYDIISESYDGCLLCGKVAMHGKCGSCRADYQLGWCVGERDEALKQTIDAYKFSRRKAAYTRLAQLLDEAVPVLPETTIVTAIPTIPKHVRQRGYDHVALVAQEFARLRKLRYDPMIRRNHMHAQRGANRAERYKQASEAFYVESAVSSEIPYLLIDDIVTTGATIMHASQVLKEAGAATIMAGVLARQPLK